MVRVISGARVHATFNVPEARPDGALTRMEESRDKQRHAHDPHLPPVLRFDEQPVRRTSRMAVRAVSIIFGFSEAPGGLRDVAYGAEGLDYTLEAVIEALQEVRQNLEYRQMHFAEIGEVARGVGVGSAT